MAEEILSGIRRAILLAGGVPSLASQLDALPDAVWRWQRRGHVPTKYVKQISDLTGVPIEQLARWKTVATSPKPRVERGSRRTTSARREPLPDEY